MIPKEIIFIFINFLVGFMSDIVLNDLSSHYGFITSLQSYFSQQSILLCAFYAGITIVIGLLLAMVISNMLFGFYSPNNFYKLIKFSIVVFCLGYILDIIIERQHVFGSRLNHYYQQVGAGLWGALAFVFAVLISYFIQKYIIPLL
jgi:hypothetical protein